MSNLADLPDCYRILEIEPGASRENVQRAFEGLSKTWNPNRFGNDRPRRRKAEEKLLEITAAYERICREMDSTPNGQTTDSAATANPGRLSTGAVMRVREPFSWSRPWKHTWIVAVVFAAAFLVTDSVVRTRGIYFTTSSTVGSALPPARDPHSPSGYYGNSHLAVMPALGTDGYHWIMQTERMLAGEEGVRVHHVNYDGPPGGREVHWSSSLHWLVASLAWMDHLVTGAPMSVSLERTMPWANTFVLALLILLLPPLVVRRFGPIPTALLALGFVISYPYYEFSFVGYFDHHGLVASCDLLMVLFLVGAGAGWLRDDTAKLERLSPLEKTLWEWLPDRPQAKRWLIASAIAGGTGLWISTASVIPCMFGIGVAALIGGWMARSPDKKMFWRMDPTLWRTWGAAGACTSLFYYFLEYFPSHMGWRLEVNHPLYALAWYGAGDLICRLCQLMRQKAAGPAQTTLSKQLGWLLLDLAMVFAIPLAVLLFQEKVFVILPRTFLLYLHQDYILEFRTFLKQMGFLSPMQIAGGISAIPLTAVLMLALLFVPEVSRPWKAILLTGLFPGLVMLFLAGVQIRWLGIDCGACVASLTAAVLVVTKCWPEIPWNKLIVAFSGGAVLISLLLYFGGMHAGAWGIPICMLCAVGALLVWTNWDRTMLVLGAAVLWQTVMIISLLNFGWAQDWANQALFNPNELGWSLFKVGLVGFLPAFVVGAVGLGVLNWKGGETRRAFFGGLFLNFILLVVVPYPVFSAVQWIFSGWATSMSDLDLTQVVTRDVSQRLRMRLGKEEGVIISGPTTTTWMMYFGGFRGVGTLYWENTAGLEATAAIYSAKTPEDAYKLIKENHVTHIAIYSWDAFALEYARLARGLRLPKNNDEEIAEQPKLADAFILQLLQSRRIPPWLRPLPFRLPQHPTLEKAYMLVLEVVPEQSFEEAQVRNAQWMITSLFNSNASNLDAAEAQLHAVLNVMPDYLPALSTLALLQQSRNQTAAAHLTVQQILQQVTLHPDKAATLKLEDRVDLGIALLGDGQMNPSAEQIVASLDMADEKSLRHLQPERLLAFLQLIAHLNLTGQTRQNTFLLGLSLLPANMQAIVLADEASTASNLGNQAKAVDIYRQALLVNPLSERADPAADRATVNLARILATSPNASLRNGAEALALAQKAAEHTNNQSFDMLDLLACASAEAGHFDDAIFYASQAVALADNAKQTASVETLRQRLDLFKQHQAFHEK